MREPAPDLIRGQSSATGTPRPAWRKLARIWGSRYLDVFVQISSGKMPGKSYLSIPLILGEITPVQPAPIGGECNLLNSREME